MRGWLITHKDCLDGATAAIVGESSGLAPIFVEPDRVEAGLAEVPDQNPIYLADVSLRPEAWGRWRERIRFVLDHHQSARHMATEPNVLIDQSHSGGPLLYRYAVQQGWLAPTAAWDRLASTVERYDLWKPHHDAGQDMNRLFHQRGYNWYRDRFGAGWTPFTPDEADSLAGIVREEAAFVSQQVARAIRYQNELPFPIYAVVLEEEGPINIVSHHLLERGAGLVLSIKPENRLSVRSDKRVDAALLMERLFHGGGHPRAAGGRLPDLKTPSPTELLRQISAYLQAVQVP